MKQRVRLSYRSNGLRPPVYAVTSLSEPQWEPVEMHSHVLDDNELEFWREFDAEEGEHQYKFRLGPGDWWVLDESKPSVDDGFGNRNNVLLIKAPAHASRETETTKHTELAPHMSAADQRPSTPLGISITPEDTKHSASSLRLSPTDPMTPPMTPEMSSDSLSDAGKFQTFPAAELSRPGSAASHYSDKSIEEGLAGEPEASMPGVTVIPGDKKQPASLIDAVRYFFITLGTWLVNAFGGGARLGGAVAIFVGLAAIAYRVRDARNAIMPSIIAMLYPSRNSTESMV